MLSGVEEVLASPAACASLAVFILEQAIQYELRRAGRIDADVPPSAGR